ncbi:phage portal protein [Novosphingobium sp. FSY-8]|uniref:Phage portal protein n=1 Tax=Novosphingobium ovatum TaxID=1908523 RepID=A0ABW9XAK6_9SPHN|nr:phage portal protein [Novosphingobium ovatum]NBC35560.1 phage portal protein [Novosphingobium ovatum]
MTDTPHSVALTDQAAPASAGAPTRAFAFGDAVSVMDQRDLAQYFEIWHNGRWYEPPLPLGRIAQAFNMSPYHRSAVALKVNMLVAQLVPSRWLTADAFERFALDFIHMGNAYLEWVPNMAGRIARAEYAPALYLRAGLREGQYWFTNGAVGQEYEFAANRVFHLMQPDVAQEVYGVPEWLSALQSGLLSENATLFRRRYYLNGAHAGFIFYLSERLADAETAEAIDRALNDAKGRGNFRNLFVNIPGGKKDGVQLIPISDVAAKDEFSAIKTISRDDLLAAQRVPPQLIGIIPNNAGGFGKVSEARDAFFETEIVPIQRRMLRANDWAGVGLIAFRDYVCTDGTIIQQDGTKIPAGAARAARLG